MEAIDAIIEKAGRIQNGEPVEPRSKKFNTYAVSNFRGGIGKSTLSFNLAYEISANYSTLLMDLCPQRNMTQSLLGEDLQAFDTTIYDALLGEITNTDKVDLDDLIMMVSAGNKEFLGLFPAHKNFFCSLRFCIVN